MRIEDIGIKRKQFLSSEQPEKKLKVLNDQFELPRQVLDEIPKDYCLSFPQRHHYDKKIHSDDDVPYYTFQLQFKIPSRFHPQSRQPQITYEAIAFQFNPNHEELNQFTRVVNLSALSDRWIILPFTTDQSGYDAQDQFYRAIGAFAKHWKQWRESHSTETEFKVEMYTEEVVAWIVQYKRIVWPDEGCFLPYLNSVGYNTLRRREKRRRSIVMEDLGIDDSIWTRYFIVEFAEPIPSAVGNLLCVHDLVTGVTKTKIQNSIESSSPESQDSVPEDAIIERVITGRRYSISSETLPPMTRRFSLSSANPFALNNM